jgi:hypothetical protein
MAHIKGSPFEDAARLSRLLQACADRFHEGKASAYFQAIVAVITAAGDVTDLAGPDNQDRFGPNIRCRWDRLAALVALVLTFDLADHWGQGKKRFTPALVPLSDEDGGMVLGFHVSLPGSAPARIVFLPAQPSPDLLNPQVN